MYGKALLCLLLFVFSACSSWATPYLANPHALRWDTVGSVGFSHTKIEIPSLAYDSSDLKMSKSWSIIAISTTLLLAGCGGSHGQLGYGSPQKSIATCNTQSPEYTVLQPGQEIVPQNSATTLELLYFQDGTRQACVLNGEAQIAP